jgi:hypothetical protein
MAAERVPARAGAAAARRRRARLAALAGLLACACSGARALDLPELMGLLAHRPSGQARFTEQRFVKGLDAPLVSSGLLEYQAPDRFSRHTLEPRDESVRVEGNTVTFSRGGRSRTLALDAAPEAVVAIEAVRGTLTGDAAVLQKWFRVSVAGQPARWTMELVPQDTATAGALAAVHVEGRQAALDTIETRLADGTRTVMHITPVAAGAAVPASAGAPATGPANAAAAPPAASAPAP